MPQEIPIDLVATRGRLIPPTGEAPRARTTAAPAEKPPEKPSADKTSEDPAAGFVCRHCLQDARTDPAEPDTDDPRLFRDAIFKGELFTKTIDLFNGSGAIVFRDLTTDEEQCVKARVIAEVTKEPKADLEVYFRFMELRIGLSVVEMRLGDRKYTPEPCPDPYAADLSARHDAFRSWCKSDVVYRAARAQFERFMKILGTLMTRATDRSFFSATGPRGGSPVSPSPA